MFTNQVLIIDSLIHSMWCESVVAFQVSVLRSYVKCECVSEVNTWVSAWVSVCVSNSLIIGTSNCVAYLACSRSPKRATARTKAQSIRNDKNKQKQKLNNTYMQTT